jgi:hypothetical protein
MWVSKPMTRPDRRTCPFIIPIPAAAHAASVGSDDRAAAGCRRGAGHRRDALDPGLGAEVADEHLRDARP